MKCMAWLLAAVTGVGIAASIIFHAPARRPADLLESMCAEMEEVAARRGTKITVVATPAEPTGHARYTHRSQCRLYRSGEPQPILLPLVYDAHDRAWQPGVSAVTASASP